MITEVQDSSMYDDEIDSKVDYISEDRVQRSTIQSLVILMQNPTYIFLIISLSCLFFLVSGI